MDRLFTNLQAVLFDLDGTLVETNIDFSFMKQIMVDLGMDHGLLKEDIINLDILAIVERTVSHVEKTSGSSAAYQVMAEAMLMLEEIELRHSADAREIVPAKELISTLRSHGIRVGIVTRNCRQASDLSLVRTGVTADILVAREDVVRTKPDPEHLLFALEKLSAKPEQSLMVGDHLMDISAGKAAGMRTIGFLSDGRPADYFDSIGPDAVVKDLSEILSAVINSHS